MKRYIKPKTTLFAVVMQTPLTGSNPSDPYMHFGNAKQNPAGEESWDDEESNEWPQGVKSWDDLRR